jgi:hypothetical protein
MSFYRERPIKSVRKPRRCAGCTSMIAAGSVALDISGKQWGGDFWSQTFHPECRAAEVELNKLHDTRYSDDWAALADIDWEDWGWLLESFPIVAERMRITAERLNEVTEERERCRAAWAATAR